MSFEPLAPSWLVVGPRDRAEPLARQIGATWTEQPPLQPTMALGVVLAMGGGHPYTIVRRWREAGHRLGVVVWDPTVEEPSDRAVLEPLVVVRSDETLPSAIGRLEKGEDEGRIRLDTGVVDLSRGLLLRGSEPAVRFSRQEANLLSYLAARRGRDVPREELQREVWGHRRVTHTRAVDMAVSRLRKKIERDPGRPRHLLTQRGGGYRLVLGPAVDERTRALAVRTGTLRACHGVLRALMEAARSERCTILSYGHVCCAARSGVSGARAYRSSLAARPQLRGSAGYAITDTGKDVESIVVSKDWRNKRSDSYFEELAQKSYAELVGIRNRSKGMNQPYSYSTR